MPTFAFDTNGRVLDGSTSTLGDSDYHCCKCGRLLRYVPRTTERDGHFVHEKTDPDCDDGHVTSRVMDDATTSSDTIGSAWSETWRSRVVAGTRTVVHLQEGPLGSEEYARRTVDAKDVVWIFNATNAILTRYDFSSDDVWFCSDRFGGSFVSSIRCGVLFHCADGHLYQTACDDVVDVTTDDANASVRILRRPDSRMCHALDTLFGMSWHADESVDTNVGALALPVRVLGASGRREIDAYHRAYVLSRFPSTPLTVVHAPPGAGKTSSIVQMLHTYEKLGKRSLVITFNKTTQQTMEQRIWDARLRLACAKTIDSLCYAACGHPELMQWSDWQLCKTFFPRSAHTKFGQHGGGRRASSIVDFRCRHPRATVSICKQHKRLTNKGNDWTAELSSYPVSDIVKSRATFSACRYVCDTKELLRPFLDKYDVILVDEMQDLSSAQEQRLISQTSKPVVMVGDPMQAINNFRDDPPCTKCALVREEAPALPRAIEWYGTWRLDGFTTKFLEERFGRRMCSYRAASEASEVYWREDLVYENTFVMCRSNEHVVEIASTHPGMRVVRGARFAKDLQTASRDESLCQPLACYARELTRDGRLEAVCEMLCERSVEMADVKDMAAVSTVHQAKGFEYEHCAVHSDLLSPGNEDELNISFVAFTRHRKSLVVLAVPSCGDSAS